MVEVLNPGFYSTIQDLGRLDHEAYGVPVSGAMDRMSAKLANKLIGNREGDAVLEITLSGPTLKFSCQTNLCISGADLSPVLNDHPVKMNTPIRVQAGNHLSFGKLQYGCRAYLAVAGGFETEWVLGSRSMFKGVTNKFRIQKGDILAIHEVTAPFQLHSKVRPNRSIFETDRIEVLKGPEFDLLAEAEKQALFSQEFTISKDHSRMAYQLEEVLPNQLNPIITSLVMPGTVQLTPSGKVIILMRDCQTTGGYPRILQLRESSMNVLAQKFTGTKIRFQLVDY